MYREYYGYYSAARKAGKQYREARGTAMAKCAALLGPLVDEAAAEGTQTEYESLYDEFMELVNEAVKCGMDNATLVEMGVLA